MQPFMRGDDNMANDKNLKPIKNSKIARELQEKSVEKRRANQALKIVIKDKLLEATTEKDLEEIVRNVIKRAKKTDKGFEIYRDSIGQKPKEEISGNLTLSYEEALKQVSGENDY